MEEIFQTEKEMMETLADLTKCVACSHILSLFTAQCINGHVICQECHKGLDLCPTCSAHFSNMRSNYFVHKILQVLDRPCKLPNCSQTVKYGDEHETSCSYKTTECLQCKCLISGKDMLSHCKETHPEIPIFEGSSTKIYWPNFNVDKSDVNCSIFCVFQQLIWLKIANEYNFGKNHGVTMTFQIVPNGKIDFVPCIRIELKSIKKLYNVEMYLNTDPNFDKNDNSIFIPLSVIPYFIDEDNDFVYTIIITKKT